MMMKNLITLILKNKDQQQDDDIRQRIYILYIGDDWRNAYIVCIAHNTAVEPDSVAETMGRPCQKVRQINGLTGYVQTRNASVATGNSDITQQINNLLDGGVYIE